MKILEISSLEESSGYSLEGSFTPDLVFSKYWLMRELTAIKSQISTMYVLGSWYGNLALFLTRYGEPKVDRIINVETNPEFLKTGQQLLDKFGAGNVEYMLKDANQLDYRQIDQDSVVVNTSLTDMKGREWFDNIPPGTLVALQGRDHDPNRNFHSADDIQKRFPLSQVLYSGELDLQDPETEYTRSMTIGIK
jgi:hypothetical protein